MSGAVIAERAVFGVLPEQQGVHPANADVCIPALVLQQATATRSHRRVRAVPVGRWRWCEGSRAAIAGCDFAQQLLGRWHARRSRDSAAIVTRHLGARLLADVRSDHANVSPSGRVPRLQRDHGAAQAAERSPVAFVADGEFVASFRASGSKDFPPVFRCHACAESVRCATAAATGLVGALHVSRAELWNECAAKIPLAVAVPRTMEGVLPSNASTTPSTQGELRSPQLDGSANLEHFLCVLADGLWSIQLRSRRAKS